MHASTPHLQVCPCRSTQGAQWVQNRGACPLPFLRVRRACTLSFQWPIYSPQLQRAWWTPCGWEWERPSGSLGWGSAAELSATAHPAQNKDSHLLHGLGHPAMRRGWEERPHSLHQWRQGWLWPLMLLKCPVRKESYAEQQGHHLFKELRETKQFLDEFQH